MARRRWLALASDAERDELVRAIRSLDADADPAFAHDAFDLRTRLLADGSADTAAAVGFLGGGVSDINLAAALVADGCAETVALVRREVSGSCRSRAARAGIPHVVEAGGQKDNGDFQAAAHARPTAGGDTPAGLVLARPILHARHLSESRAPVFVLCSGRGGVGKTTLSALMAAHASSWGMRVAAIDLDLACGNLAAAFGVGRMPDLGMLAETGTSGDEELMAASVEVAERIRLWGPCARPEHADRAGALAAPIISLAAATSDIVIVDGATTPNDALAQAAQLADRLCIVSDGCPGELASVSRMGGLAVRLGVARTRIVRIENHADEREEQNFSFARAEVGLENARAFRVFEGGEDVVEMMAAGQVLALSELDLACVESAAFCIASELAELGRLPDNPAAKRASEPKRRRRWWPFGSGRKERSA